MSRSQTAAPEVRKLTGDSAVPTVRLRMVTAAGASAVPVAGSVNSPISPVVSAAKPVRA